MRFDVYYHAGSVPPFAVGASLILQADRVARRQCWQGARVGVEVVQLSSESQSQRFFLLRPRLSPYRVSDRTVKHLGVGCHGEEVPDGPAEDHLCR